VQEGCDVVLTLGQSGGRGRGSGLEIDRRSAMLWKIPEERCSAEVLPRSLGRPEGRAGIDPA
jgi:hypothetical protein